MKSYQLSRQNELMPFVQERNRGWVGWMLGVCCLVGGAQAFSPFGRSATEPAVPSSAASAVFAPSAPVAVPAINWQPCRLPGVAHEARCAVLPRPLDPAQPQGPKIELHVAVLPALAREPLPDPVVFFAGGPGQSAIDLAGTINQLLGRLRNHRDLVLIDQRGTGRSASLRCDSDINPRASLAAMLAPQRQISAMRRCRAYLQTLPHGDLRRYTTAIAMMDADAVRQALGVERWNLVGVSYGTRAALAYLRLFPRHVRRMVLDGVAPPDMVLPASFGFDTEAAFEAMLRHCEASVPCHQQFPALRQEWRQVLAALPREVTVAHPFTGQEERLLLSPDMLVALVRLPLYVPALAAGLPQAIHQAQQGQFAGLLGLAHAVSGSGEGVVSSGMHFSVLCTEDVPRLAREEPASANYWAAGLRQQYLEICKDWPRTLPLPSSRSVPTTAAPVLLLSGEVDPVTPPRHAQRAASALGTKAIHRVVPNSGHGQLSLGCVGDMVQRFIHQTDDEAALESVRSNKLCATRLPRPPALLPLTTPLPPASAVSAAGAAR